jgi:hypothetical protein
MGCLLAFGIDRQIPSQVDSMQTWWLQARECFSSKDRKGFDTLVILISWRLWKQRNARVFQNLNKQYSVEGLIDQITQDWEQWATAGLGGCISYARVVH